ncbi:MAG: hypothetical protein KC910_28365 [Candidatus Eremiobacteraeota bacterium]|nr:hypothetical protein [Candidatus Eremiobacteraeota bacterium]
MASVLAVATLMLCLGFTVVAVAFSHLGLGNRVEHQARARNAAESALAQAIEQLILAQQEGQPVPPRLELSQGKATALLAFDPEQAEQAQLPVCTDNLANDNAVEGAGGCVVPAHAAHLVAEGRSGGARVLMECIVGIPRYPYGIASNGRLVSRGNLVVGAVNSLEQSLDEEEFSEADIVANADGPEAMVLDGPALVTGNLRSAGGVTLSDQVVVRGEVRSHGAKLAIPRLEVGEFDPLAQGKSNVRELGDAWVESPVLGGYVRREGDLTVRGDAHLDGAVLFVDGDLDIRGGLEGRGAIFVTGSTRIVGSANLRTDNAAALVSAGDVTLIGEGQDQSFFQGLIYTEGSLTASNIRLVGVFLAAGEQTQATIGVENVGLIELSDYADLNLSGDGKMALHFDSATGEFRGVEPKGELAALPAGVLRLEVRRTADQYTVSDPASGFRLAAADPAAAADALQAILRLEVPGFESLQRGDGQQVATLVRTHLDSNAAAPGQLDFRLNLNEFLPFSERARVLLWREMS